MSTATFRMPSLGADMEAGTLVEWLKRPGDTVARGDIIAVVETQKGAIEVECFDDGVIEELLVAPDTEVPVGTPLATIRAAAGAEGDKEETRPPRRPRTRKGTPAISAAGAPEGPEREPEAAPSAEDGARPPKPAPPAGDRILASPAARRLAAEKGVDLAGLHGSGPGGAIVSTDVLAAGTVARGRSASAREVGLDLAAMRQAIAAAMARSKREIPHYYLAQEIDLEAAGHWLAETNAARAPRDRLLPGALLLRASALALARFPELNGFWRDACHEPAEAVHVGLAISVRGGGLVAPAIRDTDRLSLDDLMVRIRDLVARARAGRLRSSELGDATATVSSLGDRGVDSLYGVIYPPQVALIGFGRPAPRVRAVDGEASVRLSVTATLAADHRASDGHRGALFLAAVDKLLQSPEAL